MAETHLDNTLVFESAAASVAPEDLHVREFTGVEGLSTLYEFDVALECRVDGGIDPDGIQELLSASCQLGYGPGGTYRISGVLKDIRLAEIEADGEGQVTIYRASIVPRFWLFTLNRRSRCFNEMSIPDIIEQIFGEWGLSDYELRLDGSYPAREYVVQYEESDFHFINRWMERLGIFFYFEHGPDSELLVLTDSNSSLVPAPDNPEVVYSSHSTGAVGGIHALNRIDRRVPARVHVRDYNWRTPSRIVQGNHDIDPDIGVGLQAYVGDHFPDDGAGATQAQIHAERLGATKQRYDAWTSNPDFAPGLRVTVTGAPVGELDRELVLTRVKHQATQSAAAAGSGVYRNEIEAMPYETPFRPPLVHDWPRIEGIIHAKIDAESVSSAAAIDDKGRYKVVFKYDIDGAFGGRATRWVRKAEPYSGPSYGMHFTLHVATEVAIAHVHGDPDRPVIIGAIPNATMTSPLTQSNATRSAIRTRSGIQIDFQDDA